MKTRMDAVLAWVASVPAWLWAALLALLGRRE